MKKIILIIASAVMFFSCDEFLEETPTGTLTTESNVSSYDAGVAFANACYRQTTGLLEGSGGEWGSNLPSSFEFATGKAYSTYQGPKLWQYEADEVSGNMAYFNPVWDQNYWGIRACNLAIDRIPTVDGLTAEDKSRLLGEVRTLRAWYYFWLVRYFGDVPMNVALVTELANVELPRTSLKTIYDEVIIPDLEFAVNESALQDVRSGDGRITKHVARTILADVYLTCAGYPYQEVATAPEKNWCSDGLWSMSGYPIDNASAREFLNKSKSQLDAIINSGAYSLFPTYDDLHDPDKNNQGEFIFQAQFNKGIRSNGWIYFALPMGSRTSVHHDEFGTFIPSKSYSDSYDPADLRIQERQMFYNYDTKAAKHDPNEPPVPKFTLPHLFKYYDKRAIKVEDNSSLNFTYYRYADILLMHTEVTWALGNADLTGINAVRERALLPPLERVDELSLFSERAWELVFEVKMLFDQRRSRLALIDGTGSFSGIENLVGHQPVNFNHTLGPKHLLSPIGNGEMDKNSLMIQNFGYEPK